MRFTGIAAFEGQETTDGRVIAPGALKFPDDGWVPLTVGFMGDPVGSVRVWRDGDRIMCEGESDQDLPDGAGLAVGITLDAYEILDNNGEAASLDDVVAATEITYLTTNGTVREVSVVQGAEPAFPEARLSRQRDEGEA